MSQATLVVAVIGFVLAGCRSEREAARTAGIRFRDVAAESGLVFTHRNGAAGEYHLPEIMGSGVALLDYDNDGDLDVFVVQGTQAAPHRLFRNELKESGSLHFTDASEQAGILDASIGMANCPKTGT